MIQVYDTKIQVDYVFIVHVPSYREQYGMNATRYEFAQYQPTSLICMFIYIIWECMPTDLQPWHVAENKWRGARYGMDALVITSRETDEAWVKDELAQMVEELAPIARELGCFNDLQLIHEIIDGGAGYERQRRLFKETGSWREVVEETCRELRTFRPL